MKNEPKFDIGQKVFCIKNNEVEEIKIDKIEITDKKIWYYHWVLPGRGGYNMIGEEESVFETKQDLIESLLIN